MCYSATTLTFNLMRRNPSDNVSGLLVFTVDIDQQGTYYLTKVSQPVVFSYYENMYVELVRVLAYFYSAWILQKMSWIILKVRDKWDNHKFFKILDGITDLAYSDTLV